MLEQTPWQKYQADLKLPEFQYDVAQENAVKELQRLYDELTQPKKKLTWRIKLQRTFGKGVVQTAADLRAGDDPVALKLTIAQYLLTGDYSVHEQDGVEPHIKVSSMDLSELPFVALSPEPSDLVLLEDGEDKQLDLNYH